ncbi:MAG TPA: transposase [Terriglobales bacterium]
MPYLAPQELRTFFITSVTHGRRHIFQTERMAQLFLKVLQENRAQGRFLLHDFVLMPDHFHLLITPAYEVSLEKAVQFVKGGFSYRAKKELNCNLEIWERSFTERRMKDSGDFERHRLYIRDNPVNARLAQTAEAYPYSSAYPGAQVDRVPPALKRTA